MELKLDTSRIYAIALEGGGAKGAYEIGVWRALEEAGIKYNAVSGTSVGALNGAFMAMRDLPRAIQCWSDISLSKVMDLGDMTEEDIKRIKDGRFEMEDLEGLVFQALDIIRNRGLDVSPLRTWVREVVDARKVRESDVQLYVSTVSLSDLKSLEVHVNELPEDEIHDILLASAYHPSFRLEKLGGKLYTDGGLVDNLPLHALVENGYRDIIAVHIPGMGREKRFRMPEDANVVDIQTCQDLGFVLNFDAEQARRDMQIGFLDATRVLYGLYGRKYYVERTMSEREALEWLLDNYGGKAETLREFMENFLPREAKRLEIAEGDYYELMLAFLEERAEKKEVDSLAVHSDGELIALTE